jgi:hypothetical protein
MQGRTLLFPVFQDRSALCGRCHIDLTGDSVRYFGAAEHQLSGETGETRLTSVQARLCQCFYLLSRSRINHCWSLFGTTAHLALAIGLHRKRRKDTSGNLDAIEAECRKRVFWCAYSLDKYLSVALGRPRSFHDDDIDQELPACVNDSEITSGGIKPRSTKVQSVMLAPVYHVRLSQIISGILKDLYSIRRINSTLRMSLTKKYSEELRKWRDGISHFLDLHPMDTSLMIPLFQRQNTVLNLAFRHALILLHRPSLLSNFASLTKPSTDEPDDLRTLTDNGVADCRQAALDVLRIVNDLCEAGQLYQAFWV